METVAPHHVIKMNGLVAEDVGKQSDWMSLLAKKETKHCWWLL